MKKQTRAILAGLIVISIIACMVVGLFRINTERNYKNVQLALRYTDVLNIAQQTQTSFEDVLKEFKELGATTLFVRENTVLPSVRGELSDYKEQGDVTVYEGYLLGQVYKDIPDVKPQFNYVVTKNQEISDTIYKNLSLKNVPVKQFASGDSFFIEIGDFSSALSTIGVGFNKEDLKIASDLGYVICPQVRSWTEPSEESVDYLIKTLQNIDNLGAVYFSDAEIPGFKSDKLADFFSSHQLGFVEFFSNKQKGFDVVARKSSKLGTDFRVTRLHTVTDDELKKYSPAEIMDRYSLALKERNLRTFLFKMTNTMNMKKDIGDLKTNLATFSKIAERQGYTLTGEMQNYNLKPGSYVLSLLAGMAAIMMFILLLDFVGFTKLGYWLGIIGIIGYAGLLKVSPAIGLKLMALFGAIVFPTYAVSTGLDDKPKNMMQTLAAFLRICAISFGGALTIIGTISRTSFGLTIDVFPGVKAAHIVPILLILGISIYKAHGFDFAYYKKVATSKVTYLAIGVMAIVGVALLIYTMRTGNTGTTSDLELKFRQVLDNILGVRPRTKEFLISYPILVSALHFGYKEKYLPVLIFAAIGPVSLVNTYGHIHTPILISLIRSSYGILLGFIIGMIVIQALKLLIRVMKKWDIQGK